MNWKMSGSGLSKLGASQEVLRAANLTWKMLIWSRRLGNLILRKIKLIHELPHHPRGMTQFLQLHRYPKQTLQRLISSKYLAIWTHNNTIRTSSSRKLLLIFMHLLNMPYSIKFVLLSSNPLSLLMPKNFGKTQKQRDLLSRVPGVGHTSIHR